MSLSRPSPSRRLVLGAAFLLALAVGLPQRTPAALAQAASPPAAAAPEASVAAPATEKPAKGGIKARIEIDTGKDATDASGDEPSITVEKGGKRVRVQGLGRDREYGSMNDFVKNEPEIAGMVVAVVAIVFLSPVLLVALIIGYRIRKTRLNNEALLKLAERGVVPPAEALSSIAAGSTAATLAASASTAPLQEQARQVRKRAAWSDLRKGVVMGAIGLGLTFYSMLDDGTPNSVGLVLLFVGIGYVVLWWFEERQLPGPGASPGSGA